MILVITYYIIILSYMPKGMHKLIPNNKDGLEKVAIPTMSHNIYWGPRVALCFYKFAQWPHVGSLLHRNSKKK